MLCTIRSRRPARPAFTLVEMLVSTALIMFIMYILAAAFEKGLESFRVTKIAGDMQERLRAASVVIRQDLARQHFGNHFALSDQRLDRPHWRMPGEPSDEGGYFLIHQSDESLATTVIEGLDPDNPTLRLTRSNGAKHVLQFTVRLRPDEYGREQFFTASTGGIVPTQAGGNLSDFSTPDYMRPAQVGDPRLAELSSTFTSRWAEISYFVRPMGQFAGPNTPLYSLYRRQKLLVEPRGGSVPQVSASPVQLLDVSLWPGQPMANGPKEITVPSRRFALTRIEDEVGGDSPYTGGDLLLTDVICFEVKALWDIPTDTSTFVGAVFTPPQSIRNADYPFDYLPISNNPTHAGARVFDTWSQEQLAGLYDFVGQNPSQPLWNQGYFGGPATEFTIPLRVRMRAVQIKLRIWDPKSQQTRQMTIIQDL